MKYQIYCSFMIVFFIITNTIWSQVNIEKYRRDQTVQGFSGSAELDISINTGNKDLQVVGAEGYLDYKVVDSYTFIVFQGDYGWKSGKEFSNEALVHLRYIYTINELIKLEVFTQFDYNKLRLLLHRILGGTGIRLRVFHTENSIFSFGTAYMLEKEKFDISDEQYYTSHRWSNYIAYKLNISENSLLALVIYFQPKIDEWKDFRILNENNLIVDISKSFSLSVGFNLRYDNDLIPDIKNFDTKTKIGLVYQF